MIDKEYVKEVISRIVKKKSDGGVLFQPPLRCRRSWLPFVMTFWSA